MAHTHAAHAPRAPSLAHAIHLGAVAIALALAWILAAMPAQAQVYDGEQAQTIQMGRGVDSVSLEGSVEGWEVQRFLVPATRGQTLRLDLSGRNPALAFHLVHPRTGAIVHDGVRSGRRADVLIPANSAWIVEIFLTPVAADRWDLATFRLDVRLAASPATGPRPPSPPSALNTVVVSGLGAYDSLNIRAEASLNARVVARAPNGMRLVNNGCFAQGTMEWCAVSDPNGRFAGYASARYLAAGRPTGVPNPLPQPVQPQPLDVRGMTKACRDAAHNAWNVPPGLILPSEPVAVGRGFQSSAATILFGLSGTCTFGANGALVRFQ